MLLAGQMIKLSHLDHIVIRAVEPDALVSFYTRALGCTVERQLDIGLIQLRAGSCLIDIVPVASDLGRSGGGPPDRAARNVDHFCFRVDDFDAEAIMAELRAHGAEPAPPARRYGADGFGQSIYVSDPEGNVVELKGPPDAGDG